MYNNTFGSLDGYRLGYFGSNPNSRDMSSTTVTNSSHTNDSTTTATIMTTTTTIISNQSNIITTTANTKTSGLSILLGG